jgi:putative molybdopterin biosynthesis protein
LAVTQRKPVVVLPGFPTSAVFTFHEFVAPVLRQLAGLPRLPRQACTARLAVKINSEIGRTEYVLVGLVPSAEEAADPPWLAFPMGKGSGSVTAFSRADGFITIGRHEELVDRGTTVTVTLLAKELQPADLVVIGSHCMGLDLLLSRLHDAGLRCKFMAVGSTAGLEAARRGQCDVAGIHLLDPESGTYNRPFIGPELEIIPGYGRLQGFVFRPDDTRFTGLDAHAALERAVSDPGCVMVNRNAGSGTRVLIDRLLAGRRPPGYAVQARNHNGVAAAVACGRADWGIAIFPAAAQYGLAFLPLQEEQFDFVVPRHRAKRPAVVRFRQVLQSAEFRQELEQLNLSGGSVQPAYR